MINNPILLFLGALVLPELTANLLFASHFHMIQQKFHCGKFRQGKTGKGRRKGREKGGKNKQEGERERARAYERENAIVGQHM